MPPEMQQLMVRAQQGDPQAIQMLQRLQASQGGPPMGGPPGMPPGGPPGMPPPGAGGPPGMSPGGPPMGGPPMSAMPPQGGPPGGAMPPGAMPPPSPDIQARRAAMMIQALRNRR
jgi:hypothetical protein